MNETIGSLLLGPHGLISPSFAPYVWLGCDSGTKSIAHYVAESTTLKKFTMSDDDDMYISLFCDDIIPQIRKNTSLRSFTGPDYFFDDGDADFNEETRNAFELEIKNRFL